MSFPITSVAPVFTTSPTIFVRYTVELFQGPDSPPIIRSGTTTFEFFNHLINHYHSYRFIELTIISLHDGTEDEEESTCPSSPSHDEGAGSFAGLHIEDDVYEAGQTQTPPSTPTASPTPADRTAAVQREYTGGYW